MVQFHATTIVAVRRSADDVCIGGDGQVTMGETSIMKNGAKKVKKIYRNSVLTGFAGSVADAFSLRKNLKASWMNMAEISSVRQLPWRSCGDRIKLCAAWRR